MNIDNKKIIIIVLIFFIPILTLCIHLITKTGMENIDNVGEWGEVYWMGIKVTLIYFCDFCIILIIIDCAVVIILIYYMKKI